MLMEKIARAMAFIAFITLFASVAVAQEYPPGLEDMAAVGAMQPSTNVGGVTAPEAGSWVARSKQWMVTGCLACEVVMDFTKVADTLAKKAYLAQANTLYVASSVFFATYVLYQAAQIFVMGAGIGGFRKIMVASLFYIPAAYVLTDAGSDTVFNFLVYPVLSDATYASSKLMTLSCGDCSDLSFNLTAGYSMPITATAVGPIGAMPAGTLNGLGAMLHGVQKVVSLGLVSGVVTIEKADLFSLGGIAQILAGFVVFALFAYSLVAVFLKTFEVVVTVFMVAALSPLLIVVLPFKPGLFGKGLSTLAHTFFTFILTGAIFGMAGTAICRIIEATGGYSKFMSDNGAHGAAMDLSSPMFITLALLGAMLPAGMHLSSTLATALVGGLSGNSGAGQSMQQATQTVAHGIQAGANYARRTSGYKMLTGAISKGLNPVGAIKEKFKV